MKNITQLPKWAQNLITTLKRDIEDIQNRTGTRFIRCKKCGKLTVCGYCCYYCGYDV